MCSRQKKSPNLFKMWFSMVFWPFARILPWFNSSGFLRQINICKAKDGCYATMSADLVEITQITALHQVWRSCIFMRKSVVNTLIYTVIVGEDDFSRTQFSHSHLNDKCLPRMKIFIWWCCLSLSSMFSSHTWVDRSDEQPWFMKWVISCPRMNYSKISVKCMLKWND